MQLIIFILILAIFTRITLNDIDQIRDEQIKT